MDKLTRRNSDFKEFLRRIKNDIQSREIRREKYDRVWPVEDLIKRPWIKEE
jgi:hypothetical protein